MNPAQDEPVTPSPAAGKRTAISLRGVSRHFEGQSLVRALINVNLDIQAGEIFGLLGPSGSGKTTALRIVAGRLAASEGRVKVLGRSPRRRAIGARIGYLPANGEGNRRGVIAAFRKFFSGGDARHCGSSGLSRNACLAQLLAQGPEVLVLDEPFSGLNDEQVLEWKGILSSLAQRGRTVILSSNSLAPVLDVCGRIGVLHGGILEAVGAIPSLLCASAGLRALAELLPPTAAHRALAVVREELETLKASATSRAAGPVHGEAPIKESAGRADEKLDALARPRPVIIERQTAAPKINHQMLADLTRPEP